MDGLDSITNVPEIVHNYQKYYPYVFANFICSLLEDQLATLEVNRCALSRADRENHHRYI